MRRLHLTINNETFDIVTNLTDNIINKILKTNHSIENILTHIEINYPKDIFYIIPNDPIVEFNIK